MWRFLHIQCVVRKILIITKIFLLYFCKEYYKLGLMSKLLDSGLILLQHIVKLNVSHSDHVHTQVPVCFSQHMGGSPKN